MHDTRGTFFSGLQILVLSVWYDPTVVSFWLQILITAWNCFSFVFYLRIYSKTFINLCKYVHCFHFIYLNYHFHLFALAVIGLFILLQSIFMSHFLTLLFSLNFSTSLHQFCIIIVDYLSAVDIFKYLTTVDSLLALSMQIFYIIANLFRQTTDIYVARCHIILPTQYYLFWIKFHPLLQVNSVCFKIWSSYLTMS